MSVKIECPKCGAPAGEKCVDLRKYGKWRKTAKKMRGVHSERDMLAANLPETESLVPAVGAPAIEAERVSFTGGEDTPVDTPMTRSFSIPQVISKQILASSVAPAPPATTEKFFRVTRDSRYGERGVVSNLRKGKIVSDRLYSMEAMKRQCIPLEPCEPPPGAPLNAYGKPIGRRFGKPPQMPEKTEASFDAQMFPERQPTPPAGEAEAMSYRDMPLPEGGVKRDFEPVSAPPKETTVDGRSVDPSPPRVDAVVEG